MAYSITLDGITFQVETGTLLIEGKLRPESKTNNDSSIVDSSSSGSKYFLINAVDIDWNNALLPTLKKKITSSGAVLYNIDILSQLISEIKNSIIEDSSLLIIRNSQIENKVQAIDSSIIELSYQVNSKELLILGYVDAQIVGLRDTISNLQSELNNAKNKIEELTARIESLENNTDSIYASSSEGHFGYQLTNHSHDNYYSRKDHSHLIYATFSHTHLYTLSNHGHNNYYTLTSHEHRIYSLDKHDHEMYYSLSNHSHNNYYAMTNHEHRIYSLLDHSHDSYYTRPMHNHQYAMTMHSHIYSLLDHSHDSYYSRPMHNHQYAMTSHTHNYSLIDHAHDYYYSYQTHYHTDYMNVSVDSSQIDSSLVNYYYGGCLPASDMISGETIYEQFNRSSFLDMVKDMKESDTLNVTHVQDTSKYQAFGIAVKDGANDNFVVKFKNTLGDSSLLKEQFAQKHYSEGYNLFFITCEESGNPTYTVTEL